MTPARTPRFEHIPLREPRLLEGVALFNAGRFFESHEVWESLWHDVDGPERALLQGLIQIAAAYYHVSRANPQGAGYLFTRGRRRLVPWVPRHAGLALDRFLKCLDRDIERLKQGRTLDAPPRLRIMEEAAEGTEGGTARPRRRAPGLSCFRKKASTGGPAGGASSRGWAGCRPQQSRSDVGETLPEMLPISRDPTWGRD